MTFHSDLTSASDTIARVAAINAKHEAERQRMIEVLNQAIVLIGVLTLFGLAVMHGAEQSRKIALDRQEQEHVASK